MVSIEDLAAQLRAAADERRLRLLRLCADGPASVSALAAACADSEPNVSRQLKQLAEAGLVQRTRQGQYVEYTVPAGDEAGAQTVQWLLARIGEDDAAVRAARIALQQARDAEALRGAGRGPVPPSRFGRALAAALAPPAGARAAARVLLRARHPELLAALAAGARELVLLAASATERAQLRRWAAEQRCAVEVELAATLLARSAVHRWDLVVLDGGSARGDAPAALEADFALARRLLAPQGRAWVVADYDALESAAAGAAAPPQRLRGLMLAAGLECQDLIPVESAGRHVLVARSAPLRATAPLARSA